MKFADFAAQRVDVSGKVLVNDKGFFKAGENSQADLATLLRMQTDTNMILSSAQQAAADIKGLLDQFEVDLGNEEDMPL